jgi:hypothetical protein
MRRIGADGRSAGVTNAPGQTHRHQRFMPVVAIRFIFQADVRLVGAGRMADRPALVNPATVGREGQGGREQPRKGPVQPIFGNVAVLGWIGRMAPQRHDRLVGDGGVIECHRAVKVTVPGDAMGVDTLRTGKHRRNGHHGKRRLHSLVPDSARGCIACTET